MDSFFFLCFGLTAAIIVIAIVGMVVYFVYNLSQPTVTRRATVIGKRTSLHQTSQSGFPQETYYCSFEFADGERAEYAVGRGKYGLLAEGDRGELDTKGAFFWDFRRAIR